jgi:L-aminopeptidase/D-esterase-like protein
MSGRRLLPSLVLLLTLAACIVSSAVAQGRPRGRDLGIPFPGQTGPLNAITDVAGTAVGHVTLIQGEGKLVPGKGPVRTGVTAVLPRPRGNWDPVFAATFNQNGNGDMTGINWIEESGFMEGPILLTGTHSVGTVRDAAIQWQLKHGREFLFTYPIVAETFDFLNDANGEHVKAAHAFEALERARPGPVEEGAVGGGTGMGCNGFKGGIGTSSRVLTRDQGGYTIGVLVQCNYGGDLRILGVPIRSEITNIASNWSGDLFLAFSTANPGAARPEGTPALVMLPNDRIDPLFQATVDATEEAVVNAMLAARTMTGADGIRAFGLPGDRVVAVLRKYQRMK